MFRKATLAALLAASLTGCATGAFAPQDVALTTAFSPADVAWFSNQGTGSIAGQAFFQTRGGQPRTCAGLSVELLPDSAYLKERVVALYGNPTQGYRPALARAIRFTPDDPTYTQTVKKAVCDAQGNFLFDRLPAGRYYLFSNVTWTVPGNYLPEGGWLMQSVELGNGETKRVILTP